jgi:fructokinase
MTAPEVTLVAGEALFDLVLAAPGADGAARGVATLGAHPGGGPFNTARTIGRLGQPAAFLGRISTDRFGTTLARMLAEDGVRDEAIVRTDEPTTLALADLDSGGAATYRFYAAGTSAPGLTPEAALAALPERVGALHVGTLGLVLEPMAAALEGVVAAIHDRTLVALDPNCRPWTISDPEGFRARLHRVLAHSHLVKVSEEDLAWLDPGRPAAAAARALLDRGPTVVLLTRGAAGATVVTAGGDVHVPAPPADVVDTIGAGDAFSGGFLAWWRARGLGRRALADTDLVVKAAGFASLVAARTVARAGATPPTLAEMGPLV